MSHASKVEKVHFLAGHAILCGLGNGYNESVKLKTSENPKDVTCKRCLATIETGACDETTDHEQ